MERQRRWEIVAAVVMVVLFVLLATNDGGRIDGPWNTDTPSADR